MGRFGHTIATRRRELRFTLFAAATLLQFLLILAFSSVPLSMSDAQALKQSVPNPSKITAAAIFQNNVFVGFPMFAPGAGVGWFTYISIGTGLTISALGATNSPASPGWLLWLLESQLPFFWLELMAYGVAVASGTMLLLTVIYDREHLTHELSSFAIGIVLFILFLWDAANEEYYDILVGQANMNNPGAIFLLLTGWIPNVAVGLLSVWAFSNSYGPRLKLWHWAVVLGLTALLLVFPLVYVVATLSFLGYLFWKKPQLPMQAVPLPPPPVP